MYDHFQLFSVFHFFIPKKTKIMSSETLSNSLLRYLNRLYSDANDYDVFRVILKYIYTGTVTLDVKIIEMNLVELLVAADEINLDELIDYIQKHVATSDQELREENVIKLFNSLSHHQGAFNILYEYFK